VLPVRGTDGAGHVVKVQAAEVRATLLFEAEENLHAIYVASGTTDLEGNVELALIPGGEVNRRYLVDVSPPPQSAHGVLTGAPVDVGPPASGEGGTVLAQLELTLRVAVGGQVVSEDGRELGGTTVRALPSRPFRLALAADQRADLDGRRFPEVSADDHGGFLLWLDGALLGSAVTYDLELIPPASAKSPRWVRRGIDVAGATDGSLDLGLLEVPEAAFARGQVIDSAGSVGGAELNLYQVYDPELACIGSDRACQRPARLCGSWRADDNGWVRVVLPDP
jgi:hypothetical protein